MTAEDVIQSLALIAILFSLAVTGNLSGYCGISAVLLQWVYMEILKRDSDRRIYLLPERLQSYAHLKGNVTRAVAGALSPGAHEVLLGTLKKVETKAAALLVVLSLTLTLTATIAALPSSVNLVTKVILYTVICLHFMPIMAVFRCFEQADSMDIEGGQSLELELQAKLLGQLATKELRFRFAYESTTVILLLGGGGLLTWIANR